MPNPFSALKSKIFAGVAISLLLCLPISYCKGVSNGKDEVYAKLRIAEAEAAELADAARASADEKQRAKAVEFNEKQQILKEAIQDAEADDTNALDAIF